MTFSIITPSFRQLAWLQRCLRSVADQGFAFEHIIQDAGTGSDLEATVRSHSSARLFVERDTGMYDAINRGLDRATGDFCGLLNCDDQYLPGTLRRVAQTFDENPWADAVAGDYLVLNPENRLLSFRKITPLRAAMIQADHLYAFTCAIFFRRALWKTGVRFDPSFQSVADAEWVCEILRKGHRFARIPAYLSAFYFTGENRSAQPVSREEERRVRRAAPVWLRLAAPWLRALRRVEKCARGGYRSGPIRYAVYADADAEVRTEFVCERPTFRYPAVGGAPTAGA